MIEQADIKLAVSGAYAGIEQMVNLLEDCGNEIASLRKQLITAHVENEELSGQLADLKAYAATRADEMLAATLQLAAALKDADAKQAKIDELMLEFCPDYMTLDQIAEWAKHQKPYKGDKL